MNTPNDASKGVFAVVAVNIATGANRVMATGLTEENAEAYVAMAVARRGVEVEFFKAVPHQNPKE
jgi:hypothetical protein